MKYACLFLLFLSMSFVEAEAQHPGCTQLLMSNDGDAQKNTAVFIAYLDELYKEQIITTEDLKKFYDTLKLGQITNPISLNSKNSASQVHYQSLQQILDIGLLDQNHILNWASQYLELEKKEQESKYIVKSKTKSIYSEITFIKVPAGTFSLNSDQIEYLVRNPFQSKSSVIETTLSQDIEVMDSPMTQFQWAKRYGKNFSKIRSYQGYFAIDNPNTVSIQTANGVIDVIPERPATGISWYEALIMANMLSEELGLRPAYDLSNVQPIIDNDYIDSVDEFSNSKKIKFYRIPINAPNENIYLAEGVRLPTKAEQLYLYWLAKNHNGKNLYELNEFELNSYIWHERFSEVDDIKTGQPFLINGQEIFNLVSYYSEWAFDLYQNFSKTRNSLDPVYDHRKWWQVQEHFHDPHRVTSPSATYFKRRASGEWKPQVAYAKNNPHLRGSSNVVRFVRTIKKK